METPEQEGSVIFSFKEKWLEPLKNGQVKVFFRKRTPRAKPRRVYFYVGSPISAIIGWAEVLELQRLVVQDALDMTSDGAIARDELERYLNGSPSVGVLRLGVPVLFSEPLTVSAVRRLFNFHPPQNFFQISGDEAYKMDELAK